MNKEQKLKLFMAWFNNSWISYAHKEFTPEFTYYYRTNKYKSIVIVVYQNVSKLILKDLIDKADELDLSLFIQYNNKLEIEIS